MSKFQQLVNSMTNWENHQWARDGYPGRISGYRNWRVPEDKIPPKYDADKLEKWLNNLRSNTDV